MTGISKTDDELVALLDDLESFNCERKESFSKDVADKVRQAICAFANDFAGSRKPGVLFVGAKDDGTPSGLRLSDQLLLDLANMPTDGRISPMPVLLVEKRILKGAEMAVVTVVPSDSPPVKYDGRVWIRTGANRAKATVQEERILTERRRYGNLPFDLYPVVGSKVSDLSRSIFENEYLPNAFAEDVLAANGRTFEEKLASCRMIVSPEDTTPTLCGLLAIGKTPQDYLPGAYVQFLRIAGTELTDEVVDSAQIAGSLTVMLNAVNNKFRAHNAVRYDITKADKHIIAADFPAVAFQQIMYNAILHRTYEHTNAPVRFYWFDDRIEIQSPGGPYGNVSVETFAKPGYTDYRNPNLADAMSVFGYVQGFGRGIALAKSALAKNGFPELEFQVELACVNCILRGRQHD